MKRSNRPSWNPVTAALVASLFVITAPLLAASNPSVAQWDLVVNRVDAGGLSIAPEFEVAIYENLFDELVKTKRFGTVLRGGDRSANGLPALLFMKTTVE